MNTPDFTTRVHGKWVLCGEHAVLRGYPAIAFPLFTHYLDLQFHVYDRLEFHSDFKQAPDNKLLHDLFKHAMSLIDKSDHELHGKFYFSNTIPVGMCLGASAALSVAVARWFVWRGWLPETDLLDFARRCEDLFHGESSGMDIAAVSYDQPILYQRAQPIVPVELAWQPNFQLHFSDERGDTARCVAQVKELYQAGIELGQIRDRDMAESVELALSALTSDDQALALDQLVIAMNKALACFQAWGLVDQSMQSSILSLQNQGVLSVKPTGSGGGGVLVSLHPNNE